MSTSVTFNGTAYSIPASGELNWGALSNFLIDVGQHAGLKTAQLSANRVATSSPVTVSNTTDASIFTNLTVPGAVTVNLPAGADGQAFWIVDAKGDAGTNNITINRNGSDTIVGGTTVVLAHNNESILLQFNAATGDWKILASLYRDADSVTLTGVETITNKWYKGGTASTTNRTTVAHDTAANLATLAPSLSEGDLVYDTTNHVINWVNNSNALVAPAAAVIATPSVNGYVSTVAQSFAGLKTFQGGISVSGNIRASEGAGTTTFTVTDNREQTFNLSANRTAVLPTTGVLAGDVWNLINPNAFQLLVQASDTSNVAFPWGSSVQLQALINTPVASTDWKIVGQNVLFGSNWTAYTPTYSVGTGVTSTLVCNWMRPAIDTVQIYFQIKFSGTNSGGAGFFTMSVPTYFSYASGDYPDGTGMNLGSVFWTTGSSKYIGGADLQFNTSPGTNIIFYLPTGASFNVNEFPWNGFAANDRLNGTFSFKATQLG